MPETPKKRRGGNLMRLTQGPTVAVQSEADLRVTWSRYFDSPVGCGFVTLATRPGD